MGDALTQSWLNLADGSRFDLHATTSVGRSPENGLVLQDGQVSRRHAMLQAQGEGEFWLVDLGSANGSYLNGRRIAQPTQLKSGDEITLSGVALRFGSAYLANSQPSADNLMAATMLSIRTAKCWMMMVDIIGSTAMAQTVSAEEWPLITGAWFRNCREIIERNGGEMMKYLGDGFFCYWIADAETPAKVRAALEEFRTMQAAAAPPFRIVLHCAKAVLGSVPTMQELNLHGPEVNFTFRIEKIAGSHNLGVMFSEKANAELGLATEFIVKSKVESYSGEHNFYSPV